MTEAFSGVYLHIAYRDVLLFIILLPKSVMLSFLYQATQSEARDKSLGLYYQ